MRNRIILILLLLQVCFEVCSFNFYFTNINSDMGLSQNNVKSIFQDSYGFIWFGTKNRLNRYDGNSIKVFDCYDGKKKIGNNNIGVVFESADRKLWLGTDKGIYIFDPVYENFTFFDTRNQTGEIIEEWISDIRKDSLGNIWVVAPNQGVFKFNEADKTLISYTVVDSLLPSVSNPQCITIDEEGRVWIGSNGSGIFEYDVETDRFISYVEDDQSQLSLRGKNIYAITHYKEEIFIGIHEEKLLVFHKKSNRFYEFPVPDANYKIIRDLVIINNNELWVGTQFGLYVFNLDTYKVNHAQEDFADPYSLSDNLVETIFQDKEGNIRIGTGSSGVDNLSNHSIDIKKYLPTLGSKSIKSTRIGRIIEDNNGDLWIGTADAGVFKLDKNKGEFSVVPDLHYNKILSLLLNEKEVWIGYFKNGLDVVPMDLKGRQPHYYSPAYMGLNEESVYALCKDKSNNIWLGNAWGVYLSSGPSKKFERQTQFGWCYTYDIMEDSEGDIWLATMGSGVFRYIPATGEVTHFVEGIKENTLSSNSVSSITEDHRGQIWFSTDRGGVCVFNKEYNEFRRYSIEQGLPDNVAYKIVEDKYHRLWFGTNKGLVKLDPQSGSVMVFTKDNGLPSNQFNYNSGYMTSDGEIFFGTSNGLISFDPYNIKPNSYIPPVYINKLCMFNEEIRMNAADSILHKSPVHSKQIILPYNRTNITLSFVALSYSSPQSNQYMYKMENIDADWIHASESQSASYSNLSPGKYRFKVRGSNSDGVWNPEEIYMDIIVTPPWWRTTGAYLIYIVGLIIVTYCIIRISTRKYVRRQKEKQKIYKMEREKDLYEDKVNFFTNIAHEIRTPLTLISGPLESLLEKEVQDESDREYLQIMEYNTRNLLMLVNQLLDFRKVDDNNIRLHFRKVEFLDVLNQIIYLFKVQINKAGKEVLLHAPEEPVYLMADKKELSKIINNLISNAIKYSQRRIEIFLTKDGSYAEIRVKNDGELIPEKDREKIFDPFFQVKKGDPSGGFGIGLSLARSLTRRHAGSLTYHTGEDCNNFVLRLPLYEEAVMEPEGVNFAEPESYSPYRGDDLLYDSRKITILLVEDNLEIVTFLTEKLNERYNIFTAADGLEALEILSENKIDIVISDVIMPLMDGFELCKNIKGNDRFSHIIVLLLTAKSDLESKIKGLELGADAYVEKPFSVKYLLTLLNALVINKIRDNDIFIKKPVAFRKQLNMTGPDEEFINKVNNIVRENMDNSDFNVVRLAECLHMSRSGLHRKMTDILDTGPLEYIRLCRMQKAAELIGKSKYRVNEISYMVGINTPSYFIKLFQSHYGMTPKEFEEHTKDNVEN